MDKEELIQLLKECEAIQFGRFVLTSGAVSDYYIDIKKASTNPKILKKIAKAMSEYTEGYDILAGMELGAVPIVVALSLETNIPYVIIRKEKREHGTGKQIEGGFVKNKKVLIIEDVTTSGNSVLKTIYGIKRLNRTDKYEFPNLFFFHEKGKVKLQYHTHLLLPEKNILFDTIEDLKDVFNTTIRKSRKCFSKWKDIDIKPITDAKGVIGYLNKESNNINHLSFDPFNSIPIIPTK